MRRDQALPNAENRNSRNERNRSFTKLKQRTVIAAVIIVALVAVISTRPEHTVLTVQPARASELVRDGDVLPADDSGVRPIATVLGTTVRPNKWGLSATLVEVRSGSTREIAGHGVSDGLTYLAACPDTGFDLDFVVGMVYSGLS